MQDVADFLKSDLMRFEEVIKKQYPKASLEMKIRCEKLKLHTTFVFPRWLLKSANINAADWRLLESPVAVLWAMLQTN